MEVYSPDFWSTQLPKRTSVLTPWNPQRGNDKGTEVLGKRARVSQGPVRPTELVRRKNENPKDREEIT